MKMENPLIFRTGAAFRKGSGLTLEQENAMALALCRFLNANRLVRQPLLEHEPGQWDQFELRLHAFTDTGFAVMRCGLDKWMRGIDRGKQPEDMKPLEDCLKKLGKSAD